MSSEIVYIFIPSILFHPQKEIERKSRQFYDYIPTKMMKKR